MGRIVICISDYFNRICLSAAMGFFALMLVLVVFQVVARYIFQAVPSWTAEAIRYCMVWGGMLGATVAFKTNQDPRLFKVSAHAGRLWRICAAGISSLAVFIFLGPVLFYSHRFLLRSWYRTSEGLGISTMWVSLAVPFAAAVIICHVAAKLVQARSDHRPQ